jgi:hypothetical protein
MDERVSFFRSDAAAKNVVPIAAPAEIAKSGKSIPGGRRAARSAIA